MPAQWSSCSPVRCLKVDEQWSTPYISAPMTQAHTNYTVSVVWCRSAKRRAHGPPAGRAAAFTLHPHFSSDFQNEATDGIVKTNRHRPCHLSSSPCLPRPLCPSSAPTRYAIHPCPSIPFSGLWVPCPCLPNDRRAGSPAINRALPPCLIRGC